MRKAGLMVGGSAVAGHSNFKKGGSDGEHSRAPFIGLAFMGMMFAAFGLGVERPVVERERFPRGRRPQQKAKKRSNMLTVSKRVRRKHRRAA